MENNLKQLQEDLLVEWGKLEVQVTKLDLWMAENGHFVKEAGSLQTRKLFQEREVGIGHVQTKMFEVVDELELHKEKILVQIGKFSALGIRFKEFKYEEQNVIDEDICAAVKVKCAEASNFSKDVSENGFFDQDYYSHSDNSTASVRNTRSSTQIGLASKHDKASGKDLECRKMSENQSSSRNSLKSRQASRKSNPPVKCSICSKTVKKKSLRNHLRLVHDLIQKPEPTAITTEILKSGAKWNDPVQCPICLKTIKQSCMLDYHIRKIHNPDGATPPTPTL